MKKTFLTGLFLFGAWAISPSAMASVFVSINIAPPMLPIYEQPPPPADDFLWMPGYWAYDEDGYFWVPGTWVMAPQRGYLWTPGYWAWNDGLYYWNGGYWGPTVGFYGGVYYGYGYYGSGYYGGRWNGDHFYYNSTVNNVSVTNVHNTYNETINNNVTVNRVSYNGGHGGTTVRPAPRERDAAAAHHVEPTAEQIQHEHGARDNRALRASVNNGSPPIAATPRPGAFADRNARPARSDQDKQPARDQGRAKAPAEPPAADTNVPGMRRGNESGRDAAPRTEQRDRSRPDTASPTHELRQPGRQQPHEQAPQQAEPSQSGPPASRRNAGRQDREPPQPAPQGNRRDAAPQEREPAQSAPHGDRPGAGPQEADPRQPGKRDKRQQPQGQDENGPPPDRKH